MHFILDPKGQRSHWLHNIQQKHCSTPWYINHQGKLDCVAVRCCQVRDVHQGFGFWSFFAATFKFEALKSTTKKSDFSPSGRWVSHCQHLVTSQLWRSMTVASTSVPGLTCITNKCITWPSEWYLMCNQAVRKTLFEYIYMFIFVGLHFFKYYKMVSSFSSLFFFFFFFVV